MEIGLGIVWNMVSEDSNNAPARTIPIMSDAFYIFKKMT